MVAGGNGVDVSLSLKIPDAVVDADIAESLAKMNISKEGDKS
ncbi:hypothetical protein [Agrilactobacillus composti]|nr:hypothetical protein [Agrilactobacillus composti]